MRALAPLKEQERHLNGLEAKGHLSEDEYCERMEVLCVQIEKAERTAAPEGGDACCTALWRFALRHQAEILQEDARQGTRPGGSVPAKKR